MSTTPLVQELIDAEAQRNQWLVAGDFAALASSCDDELVFIHANGMVQDKAAYLFFVQNVLEFVAANTTAAKIRLYGDVGIITGTFATELRRRGDDKLIKMAALVTQVWHKTPDGWKLASFQSTQPPSH